MFFAELGCCRQSRQMWDDGCPCFSRLAHGLPGQRALLRLLRLQDNGNPCREVPGWLPGRAGLGCRADELGRCRGAPSRLRAARGHVRRQGSRGQRDPVARVGVQGSCVQVMGLQRCLQPRSLRVLCLHKNSAGDAQLAREAHGAPQAVHPSQSTQLWYFVGARRANHTADAMSAGTGRRRVAAAPPSWDTAEADLTVPRAPDAPRSDGTCHSPSRPILLYSIEGRMRVAHSIPLPGGARSTGAKNKQRWPVPNTSCKFRATPRS